MHRLVPRFIAATLAGILTCTILHAEHGNSSHLASSGAVLAFDDFEDGDPLPWLTFASGWQESGGVFHATNTSANTPVSAVWEQGFAWSDVVVEAEVTPLTFVPPPSETGIVFRFQEPSPENRYCYCSLFHFGSFKVRLRCGDGGLDPIEIEHPLSAGNTYLLRASATGSELSCEIVGEPATRITANAPGLWATGTAGLRSTHIPSDYDNFVVSTAATGCGSLPPVNDLLVNGTFDSDILGWEFGSTSPSGGTFLWSDIDQCASPSSGSIHAEVRFVNSEVWLEQCVPLSSSAQYDWTAGVLAPESQQSGGIVRITAIWFSSPDCSGSSQSTTTLATLQQDDEWVTVGEEGIAPPSGAASALGRFSVDEQTAAQEPFFAQFDNLAFSPAGDTQVPIVFDDFKYDCIEGCPGRSLFGRNAWSSPSASYLQVFWNGDGATGERVMLDTSNSGILALRLPQGFAEPGAGATSTPRVASPLAFNRGVYVARVLFDGATTADQVVQTFWAQSSSSEAGHELYAETDFEYYTDIEELFYVSWEIGCDIPGARESDSDHLASPGWLGLVMRLRPDESVQFDLFDADTGQMLATHEFVEDVPEPLSRLGMFLNLWLHRDVQNPPPPTTTQHEMQVDWVLHHAGDPSLSWQEIVSLVGALRASGIERYDSLPDIFADGFETGDTRHWSSPPVSFPCPPL